MALITGKIDMYLGKWMSFETIQKFWLLLLASVAP